MRRSVFVAVVMVLGVSAVAAQQNFIEQSEALMKANGKNLGGVLSPMAKGDKPYDQAAVDAALSQLHDTAKKLPALYPESVKNAKRNGDYSPSAKVWDNRSEFNAQITSFEKTVVEAQGKIKDVDSLKATLPTIGKSCSSCHETFRVKNS